MRVSLVAALGADLTLANPITGVIELLQGQVEKVKATQNDANNLYTKNLYFCKHQLKDLADAIADDKATIEETKEVIEGLEDKIEGLTSDLKDLGQEITDRGNAQAQADENQVDTAKRQQTAVTDLTLTIQAVKAAMDGIDAGRVNKDGKKVDQYNQPALIQQRFHKVRVQKLVKRALWMADVFMSQTERAEVKNFLQRKPDQEEVIKKTDVDAKVRKYDFKSGGVWEMLEKLKADFEAQLMQKEKEQQLSLNAIKLSTKAEDAAIKAAKLEETEKDGFKKTAELDLKAAETKLDNTESSLDDNEKDHATASTNCKQADIEYEQNKKTSEDELEAIAKAIDVLKDSEGVKYIEKDMLFLLQINDPVATAVSLLKHRASYGRSRELQRVAAAINALADPKADAEYKGWDTKEAKGPFHQVKQMMQKMIKHLNEEQNAETKKFRWCEAEFANTNENLHEKTKQSKKLDNELNKLASMINKLDTSIGKDQTTLETSISDLNEAREERSDQKKANDVAIHDAQEGQAALAKAIAVLKKFFEENSGNSYEHADERENLSGGSREDAYKGVDNAEAVLTQLGEVETDFSKMENGVRAEEEEQTNTFNTLESSEKIKQSKLKSKIEAETSRMNQLQEKERTTTNRKAGVDEDIEASGTYYNQLMGPCAGMVEGKSDEWGTLDKSKDLWKKVVSAYDTRKGLRDDEIKGLIDAQKTLEDAFDKLK